jgi:predicted phage baseplate assembly protein
LMALEPVRLDDLRWTEMVNAIRGRIPAASNGEWTLHAPVDPGVTLLELLAWLLEQRVYWMDQVPDSLVLAALELLGEAPHPTIPAATVFGFKPKPFEILSRHTELQLERRLPPLIFSTDDTVTLLPVQEDERGVARVGLRVGGRDRSRDLQQGRLLPLFWADGNAGEIKVTLWLTAPISLTPPRSPLSLLFELEAPSKVRPQWSPAAVSAVPPPAEVTWWYPRKSDGRVVRFPANRVKDGTGGLRRSGVVRLPLIADWKPETPDPGSPGLVPYAFYVRVARATFSSPPRLRRLVPNVVIARNQRKTKEHHGSAVDETAAINTQWLPLPGNTVSFLELPPNRRFKDHPPFERSIRLRVKERDGVWRAWTPVRDLTFHGPSDRVFVVERTNGVLRFGDGLTGRLPVLDAQASTNLKLRYRVGGGTEGNLGRNLDWQAANPAVALTAMNLVSAEGGAEPESVAEASQRVAAELKRPTRAVTEPDYKEITLATPGVAFKRAHAAVGYHPAHPCSLFPGAVTVFVVPDVLRGFDARREDPESGFVAAPQPDPGALTAARSQLERARLVTSEVFVLGPRYRKVSLKVNVTGDPVDPAEMSRSITDRLHTFLDPLIGGDQGDGWPFGEPVRPSALLREVQEALGDEGQVANVFIGLDGNAANESCSDVEIGEHDLVVLEGVQVSVLASASQSGGLR